MREFLATALGLVPTLNADVSRVQIGCAAIDISFGAGELDLPHQSVIAWVSKAASAVARYYGVFPVPLMRVLVNPS